METRKLNKNLVAALLVVIAVLGYGLIGKAGNLEPSAAPGPTMKTLDEVEPRIPINQTDIPLTINTPGSYYLTEDITAAGTAITVAVDDVTIDLMGYTLKGPDSGIGNYGIHMGGRSNVEIRNGTVRDFYYGIREGNDATGQNHRVINVRAISNVTCGIFLYGKSHLVKDCIASDNGALGFGNFVWGIFADSGSTVTGNTAYNNGTEHSEFPPNSNVYGISASYGCTVTGNTSYGNGYSADSNVYGIVAGPGCTVIGNTACNNGDSVIDPNGIVCGIYASSGCTLTGNTAYENGHSTAGDFVYGIYASSGCAVISNTVRDNGILAVGKVWGIKLEDNHLVDQNTAYNNGVGAGSATNMNNPGNCTFGTNHAP